MPILDVQGLSKYYGTKAVLRDLNFQVDQGETVLITGANGSGKSTLLKIILGVVSPTFGRVEAIVSPARMAYLGHNTFNYSGLSALENLRFWNRLGGCDNKEHELLHILKMVGLHKAAHEPTANFSRGMAQRLSLARILLSDSPIYLLDEPGTGLDEQSRTFLFHQIQAAKERQRTILWVSHEYEKALSMVDKRLHLENKGNTSATGLEVV